MVSKDPELERRILTVLPIAKNSWDRGQLLFRLGRYGGQAAADALLPIATGASKAPADERSMALQGLAHASGSEGVDAYRQALTDRNLHMQTVALALLRRHDRDGRAAADVTAWLARRLKGRLNRKTWDFREIPLALAYFTTIGELEGVAELLQRYQGQLQPAERRVLDLMWPPEDRERWASGQIANKPDLTGMGDSGHPHEFYVQIDAEVRGYGPIEVPPPPSPEVDQAFLEMIDAQFEKTLTRLEARLRSMT